MAVVLCVGEDVTLVLTRKLILEQAGHTVIPATSTDEVMNACKRNQVHVAVIGQMMSRREKIKTSSLIREHCSDTKILSLYSPATGRVLPDADAWLEVPTDVPPQLADAVSRLASKR